MGRRGGKATLILDSASLSRSFQRRASEADAAAVKGGRAASRGVSAPGARVGYETADVSEKWGGSQGNADFFPTGVWASEVRACSPGPGSAQCLSLGPVQGDRAVPCQSCRVLRSGQWAGDKWKQARTLPFSLSSLSIIFSTFVEENAFI